MEEIVNHTPCLFFAPPKLHTPWHPRQFSVVYCKPPWLLSIRRRWIVCLSAVDESCDKVNVGGSQQMRRGFAQGLVFEHVYSMHVCVRPCVCLRACVLAHVVKLLGMMVYFVCAKKYNTCPAASWTRWVDTKRLTHALRSTTSPTRLCLQPRPCPSFFRESWQLFKIKSLSPSVRTNNIQN